MPGHRSRPRTRPGPGPGSTRSRANSSLNTASGICLGTRCGTRGRNRPDFCFGNGSSGLWCACARPAWPAGTGSRSARSRPPGDTRRSCGRPSRSAPPSTARTSPTTAPGRIPRQAGPGRRAGDTGRSPGPRPWSPGSTGRPPPRRTGTSAAAPTSTTAASSPDAPPPASPAGTPTPARPGRRPDRSASTAPTVTGLHQAPGRGHHQRPEIPDRPVIVTFSHERRP